MDELKTKIAQTAFECLAPGTTWDEALNDIQKRNWLDAADRILAIPEIAEGLLCVAGNRQGLTLDEYRQAIARQKTLGHSIAVHRD